MINVDNQLSEVSDNNLKGKDLHIILAYRNEVEAETVNKDILTYLEKIQKSITGKFKYCYIVKPIMKNHPAIHLLLRPDNKLNESELLSYWNKGIAKAAVVSKSDKRSMDYYLSKWGGEVVYS